MIHELFALPTGLKQVTSINGIPLYGNQILNDKFIEAIQSTEKGNSVLKTVENLMEQQKIKPCFADSGLISYFGNRLFKNTSSGLLRILRSIFTGSFKIHPLDFCLGLFDSKSDVIVILISNHIPRKFSLTASNDSLTDCLLHELMHMYTKKNPVKASKRFEEELIKYYKNYFQIIFQLKLENEEKINSIVKEYYQYLFSTETSRVISFLTIYKILEKFREHTKMLSYTFDSVRGQLIQLTRLASIHDLQSILAAKAKFKYLVIPLYDSYKISFGKTPLKGCLQELSLPAEVICGYTDVDFSPKCKTSIESLK